MKLNDQFDIYRLYLVYRIFVAGLLAAIYWSLDERSILGQNNPNLFSIVLFSYFTLTFTSLIIGYLRQQPSKFQSLFNVLVDSIAVSLLMQASGGISSGMGVILAISVAFNSVSSTRLAALFFASIASLAIFVQSFTNYLADNLTDSTLTQAGILGLAYFAISLLSHQLVSRALKSEKLAEKIGSDLANLGQLNEYIIQKMQTGIIVVDDSKIIRLMNEAAWLILGMPDGTRHQPLFQASTTLDKQLVKWQQDNDYSPSLFKAHNGSHMIRSSFTNLGNTENHSTLIFVEDASYIKEKAQQMKLASLGQLTASIAHEIRNPLGAISHAAQLLDESKNLPSEDQRLTHIILDNSQRLNQVIENILKLSRRKPPFKKPLLIASLLNQLIPDLINSHNLADGQAIVSVSPSQTTVKTDMQQLDQIITTLFSNAVTHFDRNIEELTIQISAGINKHSAGPYLDFSDNGPSIPENLRDRIFEPFFTTRNEGTGLGLYVTSELCDANQIQLQYLPIQSGGNCFRLTFPYPATRKPIL